MQYFTVDPRNNLGTADACDTCCCDPASGRPGETNLWTINYAPWSASIIGLGLCPNPEIDVAPFKIAALDIDNLNYNVPVDQSTVAAGDLSLLETIPATDTATYSVALFGNAQNGAFVLNADGTYTYTHNPGFAGDDIVWYTMTSSTGEEVTRQLKFHVRASGDTTSVVADFSGDIVSVGTAIVNAQLQQTTINVTINPSANPGDIYRITIKQATMDCDGNKYYHISCYDLVIGKCK